MFKKYRMYKYILKKGKAYGKELTKEFELPEGHLSDLTESGTNIESELRCFMDYDKNDHFYELSAKGREYIDSVSRELLLWALGILLTALVTLFLPKIPDILSALSNLVRSLSALFHQ